MSEPLPSKPVSVWHYKPWWCQPWSIILTGVTAIALSWLIFHRWWFSLIVSLPMLAWMGYFILIWPKLIQQSGLLPLDPQGDRSKT
ncbi:hypothetical protein PJF56_02710 [Roseofilum sp. BLCC_M91]|uniref:DUF6737 domain-containing protein n=1 Tax=Roseofilum halophilum BLCC-M91 TaxID=3022259 RepID=A0ABT7BF12_9CYAN|nr:DUF6737 family protein [Roseofilum halophilum]MDJ1177768.1 hypothetical protein [Roseofilum halophilum BLCC-M91]